MSGGRRKSRKPQKLEDFADTSDDIYSQQSSENLICNASSECDRTKPARIKPKKDSLDDENAEVTSVLEVLQGLRKGLSAICDKCKLQMSDWQTAVTHIRFHRLGFTPPCAAQIVTPEIQLSCQVCQDKVKNLTVLSYHTWTDHNFTDPPFKCPFCGISFASSAQVYEHIDSSDVSLECPVCSLRFNQEFQLYLHLSECLSTFHPHLKKLSCHVCGQNFDINALPMHLIKHSSSGKLAVSEKKSEKTMTTSKFKELPRADIYLCEICDFESGQFSQYHSHMNFHKQEKHFTCYTCGKNYDWWAQLVSHLKACNPERHRNIADKTPPLTRLCPLCGLGGFLHLHLLIRHLFLRCPQRNVGQREIAPLLVMHAQKHNQCFQETLLQLLKSKDFHSKLKAWKVIAVVHEYLSFPIVAPKGRMGVTSDILLLLQFDLVGGKERIVSCKNMPLPLPPLMKSFSPNAISPLITNAYQFGEGIPRQKLLEVQNGDTKVQVAILPSAATLVPMDVIQRSSDHMKTKPSKEFLESAYPGVAVLPAVDFGRLVSVAQEAYLSDPDRHEVKRELETFGFTIKDLKRLEEEAQVLRELEPFYSTNSTSEQVVKFFKTEEKKMSSQLRHTHHLSQHADVQDALQKEAYSTNSSYNEPPSKYSPQRIKRLFQEAKELGM